MASHEVLLAFVEAATQGSFSAAARKLGRSQSTISAAVASLEIDLNLTLFDRSSRKPGLTPAGHVMLQRAEEILAATSRLEIAASQLSQGVEAKLTVALSDTYQSDRFEAALSAFEQRYPDLELECLIAECDDLMSPGAKRSGANCLRRNAGQLPAGPGQFNGGRAHGNRLVRVPDSSVGDAGLRRPGRTAAALRELRLATIINPYESRAKGRVWSAPSYLMLLEMAQGGFGWAPLPRWLVERFGPDTLRELVVRGWPKMVSVDALWSRLNPPGPAGSWLLGKMLE